MTKTTWIVVLLAACSLLTAAAEPEKNKELTLQDAIALALQKNVSLQVQVADTDSAGYRLDYEKGVYMPKFTVSVSSYETNKPPSSLLDGANDISTTNSFGLNLGIEQKTPLNGVFSVALDNSRYKSNSTFSTVNPRINSQLNFRLSQPLLKGFGILAANKSIRVATNSLESSKQQLVQTIVNLVYDVENAYWNLVYAYQNLEATKMSLQRSQDLLKQNEIKVKVGTAAPIDVLEAKADVANYEAQLIQAEKTIQTRDEELKRLLNLTREDVVLKPMDTPQAEKLATDLNAYLQEALENRPDMLQARLELKSQDIEVKYQRNQTLPELQLVATYYATGMGGDQYEYAPDANPLNPGEPIGLISRSVWDSMETALKNKYRNYSVEVNLSLPIGLKQEKAQLAMARLNLKKALLSLKNVENTVYSEVRQVIKELETNFKLVEANRVALELYEQKLKAEEKKLSVGLSTNFQVLEYLSQYTTAQNNALQAQINYSLSVANMNKILGRTLKVYNIQLSDIETQK